MLIAQHRHYDFDWEPTAGILAIVWKESTASMHDEEFRSALQAFAGAVEAQGAKRVLVDLRGFRHRPGEGIGPWREEQITPRYNAAGVQRFAYVLPKDQEPTPPDAEDRPASPGEAFPTRYFATDEAARTWLGGS